jgi:hypothetical protein
MLGRAAVTVHHARCFRDACCFQVYLPLVPWGHDSVPSSCCVHPGSRSACGIQVAHPRPPSKHVGELGVDTLAPLPLRSLGREIGRWWWHHPFRGGLRDVPLPTSPGMNQARGWVRSAPVGAVHQLHGGDGMNL